MKSNNDVTNSDKTKTVESNVNKTKRLVDNDSWENSHRKSYVNLPKDGFVRHLFFKITGGYSSQEDLKEDFLYKSFLPKKGTVVEVGGGNHQN